MPGGGSVPATKGHGRWEIEAWEEEGRGRRTRAMSRGRSRTADGGGMRGAVGRRPIAPPRKRKAPGLRGRGARATVPVAVDGPAGLRANGLGAARAGGRHAGKATMRSGGVSRWPTRAVGGPARETAEVAGGVPLSGGGRRWGRGLWYSGDGSEQRRDATLRSMGERGGAGCSRRSEGGRVRASRGGATCFRAYTSRWLKRRRTWIRRR